MARVLSGTISNTNKLSGDIRPCGPSGKGVSKAEIESIVLDTLISFCVAPIIQDKDDAVLSDGDGSILLNL